MHQLGSRAKSLLRLPASVLAGLMSCLLLVQCVTLALHDGQHLAGHIELAGTAAQSLDVPDCSRCAQFHAPGITAVSPSGSNPLRAPRLLDWELVVIARSTFVSRPPGARAPPA